MKVAAATGKIVVAVTVVILTIVVKARHAAVRAKSVVREVIAAQKTKPAVAATAATPINVKTVTLLLASVKLVLTAKYV